MKSFFALTLIIAFSVDGLGQSYTAASYNIRLNLESDGINRWDNRKDWLTEQVKRISPDIFGTQEGLSEQIFYIDSALTEYDYVGIGRGDGKTKGEYAAIFYKPEKLTSLQNGTFWLSETPDTVSKGWGANYERICTYTLLHDKTNNRYFWVFNAHLDHESKLARMESVKLIRQNILQLNTENYPVILMGDLNALPDSPPITFLKEHFRDAKTANAGQPEGPEGTFNGFDTSHPLDARIDYIFVSEDIAVKNYRVINEIRDNRTPSDHLPVIIDFKIPTNSE